MERQAMIESVLDFLNGLPNEIVIIIIAAMPISELRGAIPIAYGVMEMPITKAVLLSYLGNILPVIPLLVLLEPVSKRLRHFHIWRRFFDWIFERTRKRAKVVQKYEALGLILFVAIPLPVTGAWTGCMAASLFKIRFRYAFPAICIGVLIAGVVVTVLTLTGAKFISP